MSLRHEEATTPDRPGTASVRHCPGDVVAMITSFDPWSPAATAGVALASRWGSSLTGCYVDPSLRSLVGADAEPTVLGLLLETWEEHNEQGAAFESLARQAGVNEAAWMATGAGVAATLRQLGAWHDLALMERDMVEGPAVVDVLGEAMLGCHMPCLVLPPRWAGGVEFERIEIAWNGSLEAVRAIHAALPFLREAREIVLIDGEALDFDDQGGPPPRFDPYAYLMRHRIAARPHCVRVPAHLTGEKLLQEVQDRGAELLVMGAYGHSRLRERFLDGATRHALQHARIPLLMQH